MEESRKLRSKEEMSYLRPHRLGTELGLNPRTPVLRLWSGHYLTRAHLPTSTVLSPNALAS